LYLTVIVRNKRNTVNIIRNIISDKRDRFTVHGSGFTVKDRDIGSQFTVYG